MASRKRKALSLQEKLDIIRVVKENPTRKRVDIAKELGMTPSTLNSIVAKRGEIEENARVFYVKCIKPGVQTTLIMMRPYSLGLSKPGQEE
ncbi:hypothetical protein HPB48_001678 [Haemaphysalis longicornis]|uniref:HTH psq-type domain-containing protein n=1 Tax=Haemaphysalis longicornis TaxID=44386 RepID=A0A9J6F9Z1_HAELO|nr:hypothetical protein HPB48_001678 [Haemaphysalis longicornis]